MNCFSEPGHSDDDSDLARFPTRKLNSEESKSKQWSRDVLAMHLKAAEKTLADAHELALAALDKGDLGSAGASAAVSDTDDTGNRAAKAKFRRTNAVFWSEDTYDNFPPACRFKKMKRSSDRRSSAMMIDEDSFQIRKKSSQQETPVFDLDHLDLLPVWMNEPRLHSRFQNRSGKGTLNTFASPVCPMIKPSGVVFMERFMMDPSSKKRLLWDSLTFLLVIYDMIYIPLLFFQIDRTGFVLFMEWFSRIIWTVDCPLSFCTGYMDSHGHVETDPRKVCPRYLKSWFFIDFCLVVVDWFELIWNSFLSLARVGKGARWFRIFRLLRLLRAYRIKVIIQSINERIRSESLMIVAEILKNTIVVAGMAHCIACCWYGLGIMSSDGWVAAHQAEMEMHIPATYAYATSLHWSLSQFTGGMDEVRPQNMDERVFAVSIFLVAFVAAAVFVSDVTSSMTRLHMITSGQTKELNVLRWYLSEEGISRALSARIMRNAKTYMNSRNKTTTEESVKLLKEVSEPLRIELHFELFTPYVGAHPFFRRYSAECPKIMRRLCHQAVTSLHISDGDEVFVTGEVPRQPRMYIVAHGTLHYISLSVRWHNVTAEKGWVAEGTLWLNWMHCGTLVATDEVKMCCIDAKMFQEICGRFNHDYFDPRVYAQEYVELLKSQEGEMTDLPLEGQQKLAGERPSINSFEGMRRRLSATIYST